MEEKNYSQETLNAIEKHEEALNEVQSEKVALQVENEQLKKQLEQLKKEKDSYSKYWSESEGNCNRMKDQLKAVITLLGNIK